MRKRITFILTIAMVLTMMLPASACTPAPVAEQPSATSAATTSASASAVAARPAGPSRPLRVAVQMQFCSSMVGLIVESGWDKEAGIPFELVIYPDGARLNDGLEKDAWDVAVTGGAFIFALANQDVQLIGHQIDGTGNNSIFVRKDSKVLKDIGFNPTCPDIYGSPQSVRGSTILQAKGTTSQYLAVNWLESIGVKQSEIIAMNFDLTEIYDRFTEGVGDFAAVTTSAGIYAAKRNGWVEVASLKKLGIKMLESMLCTNRAYEERHDDVVAFLRLIYRANDQLLKDKRLQVSTVEKWYRSTGNATSREAIVMELENRAFIGTQEAKDIDLLNFAMKFAEYQIKSGLLPPSAIKTIRDNIPIDVLKRSL